MQKVYTVCVYSTQGYKTVVLILKKIKYSTVLENGINCIYCLLSNCALSCNYTFIWTMFYT